MFANALPPRVAHRAGAGELHLWRARDAIAALVPSLPTLQVITLSATGTLEAHLMSILLLMTPAPDIPRTVHETFMDEDFVQSKSGVTVSFSNPVRAVGNPVFEPEADAEVYDYGKPTVAVHKFAEDDYRLWYMAAEDDSSTRRPAYATSSDGITWTKPNLGQVSYGGNSNNNLIAGSTNRFVGLSYYPDRPAASRYLMMLAYIQATGDYGIHIWQSANGTSFTLLKTVQTDTGFGANLEGRELVRRDDGRFLAYYSTGHSEDERSIGAFLSDTTDIASTWTDLGILIAHAGSTAQRYGLGVQKIGDWYYGFVMRYNSTSEQIVIDLYRSTDALAWTLLDANWLPLGAPGAWDDEVVYNGKSLIRVGDEWRFYYSGWEEDHATAGSRQIGYASIGYDRLAQVGVNGSFVTEPIAAYYGSKLYVNVDAAGGELTVEVLGEVSDVPRTGYAEADCTPITTDTYETEVTWGALSLPAARTIRLKFNLTNATLFSYRVEVA